MSSREFIYQQFSHFYNAPSTVIPSPNLLSQREIGFLLLNERIMLRHQVFTKPENLRLFLGSTIASDVYHSSAYYETPEAPMDKKGWLGADLIFDIDADHIPTPCDKRHDKWTCSKCGLSKEGVAPQACPLCNGQKFDTKTWPCEKCLESAKEETGKVIEMLFNDFGFSDDAVHVFFSGHRGYHIYVENQAVKELTAIARKEIVDYVSGFGLSALDNKTSQLGGRQSSSGFSLHDFGWNKHLKQGIRDFIQKANKKDLINAGLKGNIVLVILNNKDLILKRCIDEGKWDGIKEIGPRTWKKLVQFVKDLQSAKIDSVVTTDIHRLIRMNGTLHGKTGLKKVEFPVDNLKDFDPFEEAIAFKDDLVTVSVSDAPEFRLGGNVFGPFKHETIEVPIAAAVLLICKDRAEVVN